MVVAKSGEGGSEGKTKVVDVKLKTYDELPEYMKENEFIRGHYRSEWPIKHAFFSLFRWHNETLDVWTHLIGLCLFVGLTLMHLRDDVPVVTDLLQNFYWSNSFAGSENASKPEGIFYIQLISDVLLPTADAKAPRWPFFVFMFGSMFCFLSSSICHLFCCHSHRLSLALLRMDYAGIAVMIVTSFFPPIFYIFLCQPHWQFLYLAAITVMGCFTVLTLLAPHLSKGPCRGFRAMLFLAMGFSGFLPAIHGTIVNWNQPQRSLTLAYESAMAVSYVTGTIFYVTRVPERWKPGGFDLVGHSHQIFHLFVIFGALAHYGAALVLLNWRDQAGCAL